MIGRVGVVAVKELPETLLVKDAKLFFSDLETCLNIDRPGIVFDCSKAPHMDRSAVHLLLCCLEEAMKRNGDIKLAAIPEEARAMLQLTGVDRLFETFDTSADAVNSFNRPPLQEPWHEYVPCNLGRAAEIEA